MERENLIQLISKELKLDEKIVSRAIEIIENTQRKTGDDIYFANQIASNMEISPKYAVEIAMKYTRYKNKSVDDINSDVAKKDTKSKGIIVFVILVIVAMIITSVILAL